MKYKVKRPWIVTYGANYTCSITLKEGQKWRVLTTTKNSVVLLRKNVSIEIDKERFEKYFEKVESEGKNENKSE
jgi:hypothetical protein